MNITTKTGKTPFRLACLGAVMGLLTAGSAEAVLFTGSSGSLAASVDFSISGSTLTAVLTNTSASDVNNPAQALTGVFFNISGDPALTRTSALLTSGSSVFYDPDGQPAGGVVGGEWAYNNTAGGGPGAGTQGISSSGLGLFAPTDNFPGADLAGPPSGSVNGVQYGILSAGWVPAGDNTGLT